MKRLKLRQAARLLGAAALLSAGVAGAQPPAAPRVDPASLQGSVPIELVFLRDQGPLLVRLHVLQGNEPLQVRWQRYLNEWFDYLDRDGDGALGEAVLAGAPNAASMRNLVAQGAFLPNRGQSTTLRDFGKNSGETVSRKEFLDYYKSNGIGPLLASIGRQESTAQANDLLFKGLDTDGDGKLSRAEIEAAYNVISKLDTDDDELISLRELGGTGPPVGIRGVVAPPPGLPATQQLQGTSFYHLTSENSRAGLATLMLARYDKKKRMTLTQKDIGLDDASFKRLDENRNGTLDLMELAKFPQNAPAVELVVRLDGSGQQAVAVYKRGALAEKTVRSTPGLLWLTLEDAEIAVQNFTPGSVRVTVVNQFAFILQQLKAADTKMRGYVELSDLQSPQLQFLRTLFPILDRNEDGKLTEQEAKAYFDLQDKARTVTASFSVQEHGRNFFQILDANRDDHLSPRELMTAWQRLAPYDKNGDGYVDASELPLQFRVAFNPVGTQQFVAVNVAGRMGAGAPPRGDNIYPAHAPTWFKKMDRNRDGDVSRREFLGSKEDFDRIDANGDGLIDADEAAAATKR
jgi:Ca2+-binding EF-hand superfamily protein